MNLPFQIDDSTEVVETTSPMRALVLASDGDYDGIFVAADAIGQAIDLGQLMRGNLILEKMPDGVLLIDASNEIIWANKRISEWTGEEVVEGKGFYDIFNNPTILGPDHSPFRTAIATEKASSTTIRSSEETYYQIHAAPVHSSDQEQPDLIVSVRDVSNECIQKKKLDAIHKAGMELADLTAEEILSMDTEDRIELVKSNILQYTNDLLHFDVIEIRLLDPQTQQLDPLLSVGINSHASQRPLYARAEDNGITGFVAASGQSYICEDTRTDPLYIDGLDNARSCLTVPLILHDKVIGAVNVESPKIGAFSESDLQFLETFSCDMAMALNTLELLVAQKAGALQHGVGEIYSAVAMPIDSILNSAANMITKYAGSNAEILSGLECILKNARDVKHVIQQVGKKLTPAVAVQTSQANDRDAALKGAKILVIDSDNDIRSAAHSLLERFGCIVEAAHEGEEALNMICNSGEHYDAIISDICLPDMNGYEFLQELKKEMSNPPLILMTGYGYDPGHAIVKARREGLNPNAVLFKPFRVDQLLQAVQTIIAPEKSSS